MKPEQFIREQGLKAIKYCIEEAEAYGGLYVNAKTLELSEYIPSYDAVSITDLKRLVESVDRVNAFGGLKDAKAVVKMGKHYKYLKANISNYESIYGGGDE